MNMVDMSYQHAQDYPNAMDTVAEVDTLIDLKFI